MEGTGVGELFLDETVVCEAIIKNGIDKQVVTDCQIYVSKSEEIICMLIRDKFKGTEIQITISKI